MKSSIFRKPVYLAIIALMSLGGCFETDNPPQLEVRVLDVTGDPVTGVYVALFDSFESWSLRENPVQVWRRTDQDGSVLFVGLQEIRYYIYARIGDRDNSHQEISTDSSLRINERSRIDIHID